MYKKELPVATPESQGLSSRRLLAMVRELEKSGTEMHGLMLTRNGKLLLKGWWKPYRENLAHICHSMGKSYVGTAVGLAIKQGYLRLDDRIVDIFDEEIKKYGIVPNGNMKSLTIEHVLKMSNGMSKQPPSGENLLFNYLSSTFDLVPGEKFLYNTTGSCMLGAAVTKVTGKGLREYLTENIFDKIGVENNCLEWMQFRSNNIYAAPGVASSTENNLRLGLLYLNYGCWDGEQLIDRNFVEKGTTTQISTKVVNKESHTEDHSGYGFQLWICPEKDTFKFSGGHGQDVILNRTWNLAISINQAANDGNCTAVNEIFHNYLLSEPIPETLPEDEDGYKELCRYMNNLKIADRKKLIVSGESFSDKEKVLYSWQGIYRVKEGNIHVNTELRPLTDDNVYTDFYDHDDVNAKEISLAVKERYFECVLDDGKDRTRLLCTLDGTLMPVATKGAIPIYRETVSVCYLEDEDLVIETKFLQTCFWTKMKLHRDENGLISVVIRKERLHEDNPYIFLKAVLEKVRI